MKKWTAFVCAASFAISILLPTEAYAQPVTIYAPNQQATALVKEKTVNYTYRQDGSLTLFLMNHLKYKSYVKNYAVSQDERKVILSFYPNIAKSQLIQGSTGGQMFTDRIAVTLFKNMPKLQRVQLRLNGKAVSLDHVNFSGSLTRQQYKQLLTSGK